MLMLFAIKIIDGVAKRIARIRYSNGSLVERVYPINSDVPEDVTTILPAKDAKDTEPYNSIANQEFLQYQYHFAGK